MLPRQRAPWTSGRAVTANTGFARSRKHRRVAHLCGILYLVAKLSESVHQGKALADIRISEEYANINTDLSAESLTAAGITQTTVFTATFKGRQITALLGSSYSDVNRGDWIAQIEDDGNMQLAISFGHAATELNCSVGDTLFVHPPPR